MTAMSAYKQAEQVRPPFELESITARDLQSVRFPPIRWIVPSVLPEGLTLLCGKPKLGKSWMALDLGRAVASGGEALGEDCEQGDVLYLALEDNQRRLQRRLTPVCGLTAWPDRLHLVTEAPRLGAGGLRAIRSWCDGRANPRLVIVDTLATVRPASAAKEPQYSSDYAALRGLHSLASELGIGVVVVHHVRKTDADDPFDTVSGTTGLTGAADTTLILTRRSEDGGVVLYGRGRDLSEIEMAVEFDDGSCRWRALGDPGEAFAGETKQKLIAAMKAGKQTPAAISDTSGVDYDLTKKTLQRMVARGEAEKDGRGCYLLKGDRTVP